MEKKQPFDLALVGCGDVAGSYLDNVGSADSVRITKLMDVNGETAKTLSEKYGIPWTDSYEDVLRDESIYGVIISTPHNLHYPMVVQAAEAGKRILCDKPISSNVADGAKMIEECRRLGASLSVNYALRYVTCILKMKEIIEAGCLGKIYYIKTELLTRKYDGYWEKGWRKRVTTDWRRSMEKAGGGVLLMNSSHTLDWLHFITGLKAVTTTGFSGTYKKYEKPIEVEDTAAGVMRLDNGGIMQVTALSAFPVNYNDTTIITGDRGVIENINGIVRIYLNEPCGGYKASEWINIDTGENGNDHGTAYGRYLQKWGEMQADGSGVPVTGEDALYALKVVKDVYGL